MRESCKLGGQRELKAKFFHVQLHGARRDSDECAGPDNVIVAAAECAQLRAHDSFARDLATRCATQRGVEVQRSDRLRSIGISITANSCSAHSDLALNASSEPALRGDLLTFEVFRSGWELSMPLSCQSQDTNRIKARAQNLICALMVDTEQPVGRIELLSTAERTHLLEELILTGHLNLSNKCIQELFEVEMGKAPNEISITLLERAFERDELQKLLSLGA